MGVLFFLYVCPQVVLLGKSNITLFALRFTVGHIGGDTFEAVKEEPGYGGFVVSISVSYITFGCGVFVVSICVPTCSDFGHI